MRRGSGTASRVRSPRRAADWSAILCAVCVIATALAWPSGRVAAQGSAEDLLYHVDVDVLEAGPVSALLPASSRSWLLDSRMVLEAPDGTRSWVLVREETVAGGAWLPAEVSAVEQSEEGVQFEIAVRSDGTSWYDRIRVQLAQNATVANVRLEAWSADEGWAEVAVGVLFAAGDHDSVRQTELAYPPTSSTRLRLTWPSEELDPAWRSLAVRRSRRPEVGRSAEIVRDHRLLRSESALDAQQVFVDENFNRGGLVVLPFEPGAPDRVELRWPPESEPVGMRVFAPASGGWTIVQEVQARDRATVPVANLAPASRYRRVELSFGGQPLARDIAASSSEQARRVTWNAYQIGTYRLATTLAQPEDVAGIPVAAPLGPDRPRILPVNELAETPLMLPSSVLAKAVGAAPPAGDPFRRLARWPIEAAEGYAPGTLVGVTAPSSISVRELDRLRIVQGEHTVPFFVDRALPPALAARGQLRPRPAYTNTPVRRALVGVSEVVIRVPAIGERAGQWEVLSNQGPFERSVEFLRPHRDVSSGSRSLKVVHSGTWRCAGGQTIPCRYSAAWERSTWRGDPALITATLRFHDGENPPLDEVDVRLWMEDARIVFAVPSERTPMHIASYEPQLPAPRYDVAPLLARWAPMVTAEASLGERERALPPVAPPKRPEAPPWLIAAVLGVAATVLIWVLSRSLGTQPPRSA